MVRVKEKEPKYQIFCFYVRDVFKHIDQVTADNTGIPIFMFGLSMVCTVIKTLLKLCAFFRFVLFVCFLFCIFFKGIDDRFSGSLAASITGIQVYVNYDKDPSPSRFAVVS